MAEAGKDVKAKQVNVEKLLRLEEEQFARTLERGLNLLDEALAQVKDGVLSGEVAFKLYDLIVEGLSKTSTGAFARGLRSFTMAKSFL